MLLGSLRIELGLTHGVQRTSGVTLLSIQAEVLPLSSLQAQIATLSPLLQYACCFISQPQRLRASFLVHCRCFERLNPNLQILGHRQLFPLLNLDLQTIHMTKTFYWGSILIVLRAQRQQATTNSINDTPSAYPFTFSNSSSCPVGCSLICLLFILAKDRKCISHIIKEFIKHDL